VRAEEAGQGKARLLDVLGNYGLLQPSHAALVTPVLGDLAQPLFGMAEDDFNHVAEAVDAICHAGALVDWMLPLDDYLGPNVVGTHEMLRLASRGRSKAVHSISTFATLPRYLGNEIPPEAFEHGYSVSKWMGEQMVAAARWRGLSASIYRLPFVGASSASGRFRRDKGDFLHNLIAGSIEMGCLPSLDFSLRCVMPVDYIAKAIVRVMTRDHERIGKDYDFVNPAAPSFDRFVQLIRAAGCHVDTAPFAEWRNRALQYGASHRQSLLARIALLVDSLTKHDLELGFEGFPLSGNVFGGADYPCPPLDERSVRAYVTRITEALSPPLRKTGEPARLLVGQPA